MFKKIYIGLGILWLLTISGLLAVGFGPVLFPTKAVNVAAAHLSEEGNTPVQEESSLERMSDPLPLAGAGFTLLLTLLVSSLRYYAGNQQEGAARTAAGRARHYLVTLATEEEVKQDKIESFWFGVRRGMQVGWWEEMTGRSPYLIWTYLGSRHSAYPYGIYLTVVGEKRVQDSIGMALKSLNPTLEVRQLESNPRVVIGKYARRYLSIKLGRSAYLPIKTDFGKEYNPLVALFKHLEPRGGVEQVGVDILMRPARPGWSNAGLSKVKHTREKEANKKAAAKTEANKSLASGVENKLKADAHGWNCYFVVYASGQAAASEEQLRGIGHNWFGFYSSEHNYFKVGKVQVGQPGLGYPITFADRDVLSPEESGAICRLVKAEEVPGLASSGSVNLPPSGGMRSPACQCVAAQPAMSRSYRTTRPRCQPRC